MGHRRQRVKRGGLQVDIERLRNDAGSRPVRLVEVEEYLAPFCGFGVDALVLRDYNRVKKALGRGPLRRLTPGVVTYSISSTTKSLPAFLFRPVPHVRVVNMAPTPIGLVRRGASSAALFAKEKSFSKGVRALLRSLPFPITASGFVAFRSLKSAPTV